MNKIYKIQHLLTKKFVNIRLESAGIKVWKELGVLSSVNPIVGYSGVLSKTHKGWKTRPKPSDEEFAEIGCKVLEYNMPRTLKDLTKEAFNYPGLELVSKGDIEIFLNKTEKQLIKLGFEKKYFSDDSGYWFEYKFKFRGLKLKLVAEIENDYLCLDIEVKQSVIKEDKRKQFETIKEYSFSIKKVRTLIEEYS